MLTAKEDGWPSVRLAVFVRDGGCVAGQTRIFGTGASDEQCRTEFGDPIAYTDWDVLEFDHVTRNGVRYDDEAHGIAACPWHHRLSQRWRTDSKTHRHAEREWLAMHYPEVWDAVPGT